jgi:hypothetical protein
MSGGSVPLPPYFFAQNLGEKELKGGPQIILKIASPAGAGLYPYFYCKTVCQEAEASLLAGWVRFGKLCGEAGGRVIEAEGRLKICEGAA